MPRQEQLTQRHCHACYHCRGRDGLRAARTVSWHGQADHNSMSTRASLAHSRVMMLTKRYHNEGFSAGKTCLVGRHLQPPLAPYLVAAELGDEQRVVRPASIRPKTLNQRGLHHAHDLHVFQEHVSQEHVFKRSKASHMAQPRFRKVQAGHPLSMSIVTDNDNRVSRAAAQRANMTSMSEFGQPATSMRRVCGLRAPAC